jgi:hypothetical protein
VAVVVEVVVDRGMGGGEFLQGLCVPEPRHCILSSPERLVGILGSVSCHITHLTNVSSKPVPAHSIGGVEGYSPCSTGRI